MKLSPSKHRTVGLTFVELLVVIVVFALLVAFILPDLARRHRRSSKIGCVNNLKQVGLSFKLWASDNNDKYPMQVSVTNGGAMEPASLGIVFLIFQIMSNELSTPKILTCPNDKLRIAATNFTTDFDNSRVSYFVGIDADETMSDMILSGDHNLTTNNIAVRSRFVLLTTGSAAGWTAKIHENAGNVCLADGRVEQVSASSFQKLIAKTGVATNRLVLP